MENNFARADAMNEQRCKGVIWSPIVEVCVLIDELDDIDSAADGA